MVSPVQILQHDEQAGLRAAAAVRASAAAAACAEPDRGQVIGPGAAWIPGQPVLRSPGIRAGRRPVSRRHGHNGGAPRSSTARPHSARCPACRARVGQFLGQPRLADPRRPGQHGRAGRGRPAPRPATAAAWPAPGHARRGCPGRVPHQPCGHVPAPGARRPRVKSGGEPSTSTHVPGRVASPTVVRSGSADREYVGCTRIWRRPAATAWPG